MIKKGFTPLLLLALLFSSCAEKVDGYQINGEITGMENQQVILELLTPTELIQIDTAQTDEKGKFTMKGNVSEKGFYRIINGDKFWIVLLENTKMKFVADANDEKLRNITIENYKEGAVFQEAIAFLIDKQEAYGAEAQKMQAAMYAPDASPEEKASMQAGFETFQKTVMTEIKQKVTGFVETSPHAAVYLLSSLNPQDDAEFIKKTVAILESKLPNSVYVANIKDVLVKVEEQTKQQAAADAQAATIVDGGAAPEIVMNNPDGTAMRLSDLKGKVVLVDFWASWCKPCRAENPNVVRMYHQYKNKGFDIFSVSLDKNNDAWVNAIAKDGLVWNAHVSDLKFWNNAAAKAWGVTSIPATFLLDKEGKIIARNLRGTALEAKLKEVL